MKIPVSPFWLIAFCFNLGLTSEVGAAPLAIDLTVPVAVSGAAPYGPGTTKSPLGGELTVDQQSFSLSGQPWIPVVGEFHYARYPRAEWREELLKMKAGGINTVSTYVFWIHHEEEQGKWDWSGPRSLRDFIKTAQETGLKVMVRMGPWCHGEARNGGFPDWVQNSGTGLRSKDERFLKLVEPLFKAEAGQMKNLYWKDGGPIIGVQLDNECDRADYLLALKEMAKTAGVDVPVYTITGWQGGLPRTELIPFFGGYADGFWGGSREDYRKEFLFNKVRAMNDLGAQMEQKNPSNAELIGQFPYACAEIGGGMMSSYGRRIKIVPDDVAALTLAKLGSGNNMPGFYMYHGGVNPEGKLSTMQEDHPNQIPTKDYDFQAPIGAEGQLREHFFLLREQNFFLEDFGPQLARMKPYFPEKPPTSVNDFNTVRWNVRSDGKSGFLFFSNQQPYEPLPEHKDVQFAVQTQPGSVLIPREPITIPTGVYGIFPFNLDCAGVELEYATAQPLCQMAVGPNTVFFFTAMRGIQSELSVRGREIKKVEPGTGIALSVPKPAGGGSVVFVVLTPEEGRQFSRGKFAGSQRAMLTSSLPLFDGPPVSLQTDHPGGLSLAISPPVPSVEVAGRPKNGRLDGIFNRFNLDKPLLPPTVTTKLEKPAGPNATLLKGMDDATWQDAAVYTLDIPATAAGRRIRLDIHYTGDAARLYVGDRLIDDDFFNGDPFSVALWRIPQAEWSKVRLKILPYSDGLKERLPQEARKRVEAKNQAQLDEVTITAEETISFSIAEMHSPTK